MTQMNFLLQWLLGGLTNWKTTVTAIVGAGAVLLGTFHVITITPEQQGTIIAFALLVIGWFAKDSNSTGTVQEQAGEMSDD